MIKKFIKINLIVLIIFVILSNVLISFATEVSDTTNDTSQEQNNEEKTLDSLSNQRNEIEANLNNASAEIEFVKSQLSQELYELEKLNLDILQKQQEIDIMQVEEEKLVDFIEVAKVELEKITNQYNTQKDLLEKRLVAMYEIKSTSYLDVLLNSKSISEFISNYYIISKIAKADQDLLTSVANIKKNLEAISKTLEKKNKELIENRNKSEKMKISLENMVAIKNSKIIQLSEDEIKLHQEISEYQEQIINIEKEIKLLSIANVGSEYIGGIMDWPVPGYTRITSQFGMRTHPITGVYKLHTGVDIGAPIGADFIAANDGVVVKAGYNVAYGNMVVLDHGGGITTLYAHGSEILVELGQVVTKGTPILKVGSTGYSTGPHAHFEVRTNGEYVEPLDYITSYSNVSESTNGEIIEMQN